VQVAIANQSGDIALGVDHSLEEKAGEITDEEIETVGAGDQGMMFGYACRETDDYMPLALVLSHVLLMELAKIRREGQVIDLPKARCQIAGNH